jgi:hypothetical protein
MTTNVLRISALAFLAPAACITRADQSPNVEREGFLKARPQIVEAWQDMRFGMFLCWGPVTVTGREIGWSRGEPAWGLRPGMRGGKGPTPAKVYDNLYKQWKPDNFDAEHWVKVAKDAGQKYLIFLVKHTVLTGGEAAISQSSEGTELSVAPDHRDPLDTIVKLVLDGLASDILKGQSL